ncbi:zonular occludens toxin [Salmonella enterica subsp. enterica serovar Panama]|uniref:Zonular occludens toxin n=1 Tax=Salmonella enterica subsp. enterica serovar Panama TaxID=29472 RepID=A0A618GAJ0_SALET|nr:zonular occludens toxin [Salmonella enterica subsp. enterica serovar Panama]ECX3498486.1 zonular occludens toxin [Salmonella enterica subsp. enterica serovar Panama]ECX6035900.1 zonular occludens toxin [Salmonella enterica subsp. enterica serovar Panama]EGU5384270.1 zonular occludens toxin [Salmonella enterica]EGX1720688.1 zonular occludens toxin [Salmonella enterica subsp. enterica serovar Panama]
MAITAYIGTPGSGKSYEIVRSVIIPAICAGRRIVTNIYGLSYENIIEYCEKRKLLKDDISAGEIIVVENKRITEPDFFPVKENQDKSLCQPGDLVILDECHRFFSSDRSLSSDARIFAAEHRHYADSETGFTCDLILVNQALSTLPRFLKERVEQTFRMKKLNALAGFGNKYRVDVFDGVKLTKGTRITYYVESYKKEIFPLYKSHDAPGAVEVKADGRGTLFKKSSFIYFVLYLALTAFIIWRYAIPFFFPKTDNHTQTNVSSEMHKNNADASVSHDIQKSKSEHNNAVSDEWCITGYVKRFNAKYILLKDTSGRLRMVSSDGFKGYGLMVEGVVDGKKVFAWSCTPVVSGTSKGVL